MTTKAEIDETMPVNPEQALRSYFYRELPRHWPALDSVSASAPKPARSSNGTGSRPIRRSRLALAASLLVLIAGASAASRWGRPFAAPAEPLPHDVLPPTAQKPGKPHRPPAPAPRLPTLPANQR